MNSPLSRRKSPSWPTSWVWSALAFLVPILVNLPTVLRGYPFWYDEVYTAQFATLPISLPAMLERLAREDHNPPLPYLVYWALGRLFLRQDPEAPVPGAEVALRGFSLLLLGVSSLLLYGAFRGIGLPPLFALAGGLALGLSPFGRTQLLEARGYALADLGLALGLYGLARGSLSLSGLGLLLAGGSHYLAGLLLGPVLLHRFGPRVLLFALPLFPWLPFALRATRELGELQPWIEPYRHLFPKVLLSLGPTDHPLFLALGLLLWAGAFLSRLGPFLGLYLLLTLILLPPLTGFTFQNPRYAVLLVPFLLYAAGSFRRELLLLALLGYASGPPLGEAYFQGMSRIGKEALALGIREVWACNLPTARTAKYYCRGCEVGTGLSLLEKLLEEGKAPYVLCNIHPCPRGSTPYPRAQAYLCSLDAPRDPGRIGGERR